MNLPTIWHEAKAIAGSLIPSMGGWLANRWTLGTIVREPHSGAWQQNLTCNDPSLYGFSAIYACITIPARDIAKLGADLWKKEENGAWTIAKNHPIARVLRHPNDYQTQHEFVTQVMISTLSQGNAYIFKRRDNRGVVQKLYPLNPVTTWPIVSETGDIFYALGGDLTLFGIDQRDAKGQVIVPSSEIIHHRINTLGHPLCGTTPIVAAVASTDIGLSILRNSSAFFKNMSRASGILTAPGKMDEKMAERFKKRWEDNQSGGNFGRVAVLSQGLKFEPQTINASDSQLIEQLRWSVEDVARAFGVPLFMVGELTKIAYRNSEQQARTYYNGCLQSHLEALETRLHDGLELDDAHFVEFNVDNLLRTDFDTRMEGYEKAVRSNVYLLNEARAKEDLPPVAGGDQPLVQAQYRPLYQAIAEADAAVDAIENPPAPAPVAGPGNPADDEEEEDEEEVAASLAVELIRQLKDRHAIAA